MIDGERVLIEAVVCSDTNPGDPAVTVRMEAADGSSRVYVVPKSAVRHATQRK